MMRMMLASQSTSPDFVTSAVGLFQSTSRMLILTIGSIFLGSLIATAFSPQIGEGVWFAAPVMVGVCALSLYLIPRHYLVAHLVLALGLCATITLAAYRFHVPEILFFYALLPLIAVIAIGWPAGLMMEAIVTGLIFWLLRSDAVVGLSSALAVIIVVAGGISGLLGWASVHTLTTVIHWSLFSYEQARENMEEARAHRAKLARTVKELDQAKYRLERTNHMLVLARAEAEELRDARNRFALAVSHELRAPLNFIIGFSELMVNSPDTYADVEAWPEGLSEDIGEIYRSSLHLLNLVNDVLDLGKIDSLEMALLKEWFDPHTVLSEVADMVSMAFARKKLEFSVEIASDLPKIFADRTRVRQVLLNLVNNGLRFTESGGVEVSVAQEDEKTLLFCVRDSGSGIAPEDIPRVFEAFQQVGTTSWRRREGTGLGVPISRRFIELHGGKMWAESYVGEGACFCFTLPILTSVQTVSASRMDEVNNLHWQRLRNQAEQARVVIALSSDPLAGEVIAPYIGDYEVVTVTDLDDISTEMARVLPSALLVDQAILDDYQRVILAENLPYSLPVISLALPGNPLRASDLSMGIAEYLVKPITRQALLAAVQKLDDGVRNLLVVDDAPMVRFVRRALCKSTRVDEASCDGYHLTPALSDHEAHTHLVSGTIDAMLLEPTTESVDAQLLLQEAQSAGVPTIILTTHDPAEVLAGLGQDVLKITMPRPMARHELTDILKCLLETLRPVYPKSPVVPVPSEGRFG